MNKIITYRLLVLVILAVLIILGLYWHAEQPYQIKNDFNRKRINLLMQSLAIRIPDGLTSLTTDGLHTCYFYGVKSDKIWLMDLNSLKLDSIANSWSGSAATRLPFKLLADQEHLYFHYTNKKEILIRELKTAGTTQSWLIDRLPHMLAFISKNRMVLTVTDTSNMQPVMIKQDLQRGIVLKINPWPEQSVGIIPVDGSLYYDPSSALLTYHYYRKNGFMVLDTNLLQVAEGKTIDTVLKGNTKVKRINKTYTLATPPTIVNGFGCADAGKLYINGRLKADNEGAKEFRGHTVIDVYDIPRARYLYSFYIPVFKEKKTNGFVVRGDQLICLYGDYVVVYRMQVV